jgi:predicted RNase H-like HicB family nuclease
MNRKQIRYLINYGRRRNRKRHRERRTSYSCVYIDPILYPACNSEHAPNPEPYPVTFHKEVTTGGYWVECPQLLGCASQGDTIDDAQKNIEDAIKGHLEVLAERYVYYNI